MIVTLIGVWRFFFFFFQAEDGIRDAQESRGLGDVYKRQHKHDASELYLNLTDKSGWRFELGEWKDYPAGSFIWNAPRERHAARVYEQPFISVFAWLENVNSPCQVLHFDDWDEIEQSLFK